MNSVVVTLIDTVVKDCVGQGNGGGLYVEGGTSVVSVLRGRWRDNQAANGGAVYVAAGSTASIDDATFQDNSAAQQGGAVFADQGSTVTVQGTMFRDNTAGGGGGAITANAGSTVELTESTVFAGNNEPTALEVIAGTTTVVTCDDTVVFCGGPGSILGDSDSCLAVAGGVTAEDEAVCT